MGRPRSTLWQDNHRRSGRQGPRAIQGRHALHGRGPRRRVRLYGRRRGACRRGGEGDRHRHGARGTTARAVQAPHRVHRRQARHGPQENRAGTAARQGRYRRAGRQGRQQVHGGQALRAAHRGRLLHLRGQPRENRRRGRTRRHLCGPHERRETDHGRGPGGPQLQTACQRRARLPLPQERGPDGPTHPTSSQGPGPRPHLPVHARLLRPVAHDRSLAPVALRRRGPGGQSNTGPGGTRQALEDSAAEGAHEAAR